MYKDMNEVGRSDPSLHSWTRSPEVDNAARNMSYARILGRRATKALAILSVPVAASLYLQADIAATKRDLADNTVRTYVAAEAQEYNAPPSFYFDGFGERGTYYGNFFGEAISNISSGEIRKVYYDKNGISIEATADAIAPDSKKRTIDTIYGFSTGGIVGAETMVQLQKEYGIGTNVLVLDATPVNVTMLADSQQKIGDGAIQWFTLAEKIGFDATYSTTVRQFIELGNPSLQYATTTPLLKSQFLSIATGDVVKTLAEYDMTTHPTPVLVVVRPEDAEDDAVVDIDESLRQLREFTTENEWQLIIVNIPGEYTHFNPTTSMESRTAALAESSEAIREAVETSRLHFFREYGIPPADKTTDVTYKPLR